MIETQQSHKLSYDPVVEAIRILARRGRQLREAPRNAVYEGMTPEECRIAVYGKVERGELESGQMTRFERDSYVDEIKRQMVELLGEMRSLKTEYEQLNNAFWNFEHHSFLVRRIEETVWHKLTTEEQEAFLELMKSCHWGRAEVEQVKEIIETAEWFSGLAKSQLQS